MKIELSYESGLRLKTEYMSREEFTVVTLRVETLRCIDIVSAG